VKKAINAGILIEFVQKNTKDERICGSLSTE